MTQAISTTPTEIRKAVRSRYSQIAESFDGAAASCCPPAEASPLIFATEYDPAALAQLPGEVTGLSLGCGNPVSLATLQAGETVLDLGSGGGIDCFLAAQRVGPAGRVIGVDMTPAMLERARANAARLGMANVEFRLGEIEHLPLADSSVDVIISNCVINLSADKARVFREAFRVLRPGGRLAISDIVTRQPLPASAVQDMDSWAACVSGAWIDRDVAAALRQAGFVQIQVEDKAGQNGQTTQASNIYSARISAIKPA